MIMFCTTCGTLLTPKLQETLLMNCSKCNTSFPPASNTLSFTDFEQVNTELSKQEIIDLVSIKTLPMAPKTHCLNKQVVYYESSFEGDTLKNSGNSGFGIKYVCLGCYSYL